MCTFTFCKRGLTTEQNIIGLMWLLLIILIRKKYVMMNECRAFADEKKSYVVIGSLYYLLVDHNFRTIYFEIVYESIRQTYIFELFQIYKIFFGIFLFFIPSIFFLSVGWGRRAVTKLRKKS